jgi:DNA-binding response OmpR family regulator
MRILVVEDEKKIASLIKRGLKEEGYAVDVACDGVEGEFLAASANFLPGVTIFQPRPGGPGLAAPAWRWICLRKR